MAASSSNRRGGKGKKGGKKGESDHSLDDFLWPVAERSAASAIGSEQFERLHRSLLDATPPEYHSILSEQLTETVFQASTVTTKNSAQLFDFLSSHPNSKAIPETWGPVVGSGFQGVGFRVETGKRRVPDDQIYKQYESLQRNLPRGIVFLTKAGADPELILFGNRKFFGRQRGDDDDSDLCSSSMTSDFSHFLNSVKANGECSQVVWVPAHDIWVIGSKNRKLAARTAKDIKAYATATHYGYSTEMALAFFRYLDRMGPERVALLKELLTLTKLTLNFEFESPAHQHIVLLKKERQVLIGCSGIHVQGKNLHPIFSSVIGKLFGFPSVLGNLTTYPRSQLESVCEEIACGWNTEGSVLVLLDKNYLVLDLVKVKARWYVLLRAIREKIRRGVHDTNTRNQVVRGIDLRLHTLERDMNMPSHVVKRFIALGIGFVEFLAQTTRAESAEIIANYPIFWRDFLNHQRLPLGPELLTQGAVSFDEAVVVQRADLPLLVFAQGIPGSGKSLTAIKTVEYLNSKGITAVQLAQDDFAHLGQKQSGQACFDAVQTLLSERKHKVVFLSRNNANRQQFGRYLQFDDYLCRTLFFCPLELTGDRVPEFVYMSIASVLYRKASEESHPTDEMTEGSLAVLPLRFMSMLKVDKGAIRPAFLNPGPLPIPAEGLLKAQIKSATANLKKMSERDMAELMLDNQEHLKQVIVDFHRPAELVAQELGDRLEHLLQFEIPAFDSYICALLRPLSTEVLLSLLPQDTPRSWTRHCHHMTLFHSSSFVAHPEGWSSTLRLLGQEVELRVVNVIADDRVITAVVEPLNLDPSHVSSGRPHVTLATAPNVGPIASLDLIEKWTSGGQRELALPSEPILLNAVVQIEMHDVHDDAHGTDDQN